MKRFFLSSVFVTVALGFYLLLTGCATVSPGSDPLVVRVEQAETVAPQVFTSVLTIDHADRGFWRTNAPAFHNFCEWLRAPQPVLVTNTTPVIVPRNIALVFNLDNVKLFYKQGAASSNTLVTALATLQGVINQASAWLTISTNSTSSNP